MHNLSRKYHKVIFQIYNSLIFPNARIIFVGASNSDGKNLYNLVPIILCGIFAAGGANAHARKNTSWLVLP